MKAEKIFGLAGIATLVLVLIFAFALPHLTSGSSTVDQLTLSQSQLNQSLSPPPSLDIANGSINISANSTVLVEMGPMEVGKSMYSFLVYGETNPTINIKYGCTVTFEIVNVDNDSYHNFAITDQSPPYPDMGPEMMYYSAIMSSPYLPPHTSSVYHVTYETFHADEKGNFWYICQEYGHAAQGMYGELNIS